MQHLQPNTTLQGGKYRIERVLGQGGFGNTYVGVNTVFNERIAIKEFFMQGINDRDDVTGSITISIERNKQQFQEQLEKFKKEALRIRKLDNPYIVRVHDLFEENGTAYYVMDFVDGENLSERLRRTGKPMTEQEVRAILPQILDALKAVHDAGIWHLDLKPANIMVDKAGNVKLIDFGASKQLNAQKGGATTSTAISYTNGYAPREQMEQNYDKFGPWTDIYALGATLYNLLTNKRPPLPTDIDDDISEDKHEALPFPESVGGLKVLVLQMMKTNRLQRPQNIASIMEAGLLRKEELAQTPKQQPASQPTADFDDETTIIAQPKPKNEEKKAEPKPQPKVEPRPSYTSATPSKSDDGGIGRGCIIAFSIIVVCFVVIEGIISIFEPSSNKNIEADVSNETQNIEFVQSQVDASILMHLDSLAAELGRHKFPIFYKEMKQLNNSISLFKSTSANFNNEMSKIRILGVLDVDRRVAKQLGYTTGYDGMITDLLDDINYPPLLYIYQNGAISNLSYNLYTRMKEDGKINYYWHLAAATLVEQLYLISQNPEKIIENYNNEDAAITTFDIILVLDAIYSLSVFDPELENIVQAIVPLQIINATSASELKSQIIQVTKDIETARKVIIDGYQND